MKDLEKKIRQTKGLFITGVSCLVATVVASGITYNRMSRPEFAQGDSFDIACVTGPLAFVSFVLGGVYIHSAIKNRREIKSGNLEYEPFSFPEDSYAFEE